MDFLELAKKRYSVREYETKKVDQETIDKILEAGRIAPTAANKQPQRLLVVESEEGLAKLAKGTRTHGAPLAIVVCGDHEQVWERNFDKKNTIDIDTAIVTDHMMLAAEELGLGSCWICWFDPAIISKEFNIPAHLEAVNILVLGYAKGERKSPERHGEARKPISEFVSYETF